MDRPTELTLSVGERHRVRLPGGGSAGYEWTADVVGDAGAVELSWEPWDLPPERPDRVAVGGSLEQALVVHAIEPGSATVRLQLTRLREPESPPRAEESLTVTVTR